MLALSAAFCAAGAFGSLIYDALAMAHWNFQQYLGSFHNDDAKLMGLFVFGVTILPYAVILWSSVLLTHSTLRLFSILLMFVLLFCWIPFWYLFLFSNSERNVFHMALYIVFPAFGSVVALIPLAVLHDIDRPKVRSDT